MKTNNLAQKAIDQLETDKTPYVWLILGFFGIVVLKYLVKVLLAGGKFIFWDGLFLLIFYSCLACWLILGLYLITKIKLGVICRFVLPLFLIIVLTPFLNLGLGSESSQSLLIQPAVYPGWREWLTSLFGPYKVAGLSLEIRVEIDLLILVSFLYSWLKKNSLVKALITGILIYLLLLIYLSIGYVFKAWLKIFGFQYFPGSPIIFAYFILVLIIASISLYGLNRRYWNAVITELKIASLLHWWLLVGLGLFLANKWTGKPIPWDQSALFQWPFLGIAIVFAWLFLRINQRLADSYDPRIEPPPVMINDIPWTVYQQMANISLILAIIFAWLINYRTVFLLMIFSGTFFLYHAWPWRLKRLKLVSGLLPALGSLVLVMLGHFIIAGHLVLPAWLLIPFLGSYWLVFGFLGYRQSKSKKR